MTASDAAPTTEPLATFEVAWGAASDPGHRRENQDALLARPPVFVVADGMGGHGHGREAAGLVVDAFDLAVTESRLSPRDLDLAIRRAAEAIAAFASTSDGSPGSTVTGVGLADHDGRPSWLFFNVGDSRTYRLRDGTLAQVTVDHSRIQELLRSGVPKAVARARTGRNVITRAIGGGPRQAPVVDQWLLPAFTGDRILICSDGLTGEVTDALIGAVLQTCPDPGEAAHRLVDAALEAGGGDNVTVLVVDAVEVARSGLPAGGLAGETLTDGVAIDFDTVPDNPDASPEDGA